MRAHAVVVAARGNRPDEVRYRTLRSDPPLLLRPTQAGLYLVGGAAGPLGGDELDLEVHVEAGASLRVRSAAASIVLPGAESSDVRVHATVAEGASLDWAPEPTVSVQGSRHRQRADVCAHASSVVQWSEILVLGRTGELGGELDATLRIERGDAAVVHQQLGCGGQAPGWNGVAGMGSHRVIGTSVSVGQEAGRSLTRAGEADARGMIVALDGDVVLAQAVASNVPELGALLTALAIAAAPG